MTAADDVVHGHTNTRRRTRTRLDDRLATAVVVFFPHPLETNKSGDGGRRKEGRNRNRCRRSSPASSHSIPDFQPSEEGRMFLSCFGFAFPVRQTLAPTKKRRRRSQSISAGEMTFPRRFAGQQQQKERSFFFLLI